MKRKSKRIAPKGKGNRRRQPNRLASSSTIPSQPLSRPVTLILRGNPLALSINAGNSTFNTPNYVTFNSVSQITASGINVIQAFSDWRILKIVAKIVPVGANGGTAAFGFSEDINAISSASQFARDARVMVISNSNAASQTVHRCVWTSASYEDLSFHEVSTNMSPAPVNFVAFTNNADWFTTTAVANTNYYRIDFDITVQVRNLSF